jgi:hypothetical protein
MQEFFDLRHGGFSAIYPAGIVVCGRLPSERIELIRYYFMRPFIPFHKFLKENQGYFAIASLRNKGHTEDCTQSLQLPQKTFCIISGYRTATKGRINECKPFLPPNQKTLAIHGTSIQDSAVQRPCDLTKKKVQESRTMLVLNS